MQRVEAGLTELQNLRDTSSTYIRYRSSEGGASCDAALTFLPSPLPCILGVLSILQQRMAVPSTIRELKGQQLAPRSPLIFGPFVPCKTCSEAAPKIKEDGAHSAEETRASLDIGCAPCTRQNDVIYSALHSANPVFLFYTTRHRTSVDLKTTRHHDSLKRIDPQNLISW